MNQPRNEPNTACLENPPRGRHWWAVSAICGYAVLMTAADPSRHFGWAVWIAQTAWGAAVLTFGASGRRNNLLLAVVGFVTYSHRLSFLLENETSNQTTFVIVWLLLSASGAAVFVLQSHVFLKLRRNWQWPSVVAMPTSLVFAELILQGSAKLFDTSSDILSVAITQVGTPWIMQSAALGGTMAVIWLCGTISGLPLDIWCLFALKTTSFRRAAVIVAGAVEIAGMIAHGISEGHYHALTSTRVAIVPVLATALTDEMVQQLNTDQAALTVFPEEAFRSDIMGVVGDAAPQQLQTTIRRLRMPMIVGIRRTSVESGRVEVLNSAVAVDESGRIIAFRDKAHLTPLLETMPNILRWLGLNLENADRPPYSRGSFEGPFELSGLRVSTAICHDICFASWPGNAVGSSVPADLMVQLANEGVSHSNLARQCLLACGQLRAVESRRALVRCVHQGYSAAIDGNGDILWNAEKPDWNARQVVRVPLDRRSSTFALWGYYPLAFWIGACAVGTHFTLQSEIASMAQRACSNLESARNDATNFV